MREGVGRDEWAQCQHIITEQSGKFCVVLVADCSRMRVSLVVVYRQ